MKTPAPAAMREKIKITARHLFCFRGYDKTSVEDIQKELGISRQIFSSFFSSKDTLLEELWSE